jgi:hypothetical protein
MKVSSLTIYGLSVMSFPKKMYEPNLLILLSHRMTTVLHNFVELFFFIHNIVRSNIFGVYMTHHMQFIYPKKDNIHLKIDGS